jgi:hypothetical protein
LDDEEEGSLSNVDLALSDLLKLGVAKMSQRVTGVAVTHRFAQKYHFKGVWDAAGKVVKAYMRKVELSSRQGKGTRFPNAWACFEKLRVDL